MNNIRAYWILVLSDMFYFLPFLYDVWYNFLNMNFVVSGDGGR